MVGRHTWTTAQCVEDQQAQYCECYIEWSQNECNDDSGATWDAIHNECMWNIDEFACYNEDDIMLGAEDGNINCSEFIDMNINQYTEWNGRDEVCEVIFEDALYGIWYVDGTSLCINREGGFEEDPCDYFDFEECQCNLHRCSWSPYPTYSDPDAGIFSEGSQNSGQGRGGRVQGVEHYKIKTVSSVFQDEMINYIFSNPDECMAFSL